MLRRSWIFNCWHNILVMSTHLQSRDTPPGRNSRLSWHRVPTVDNKVSVTATALMTCRMLNIIGRCTLYGHTQYEMHCTCMVYLYQSGSTYCSMQCEPLEVHLVGAHSKCGSQEVHTVSVRHSKSLLSAKTDAPCGRSFMECTQQWHFALDKSFLKLWGPPWWP